MNSFARMLVIDFVIVVVLGAFFLVWVLPMDDRISGLAATMLAIGMCAGQLLALAGGDTDEPIEWIPLWHDRRAAPVTRRRGAWSAARNRRRP